MKQLLQNWFLFNNHKIPAYKKSKDVTLGIQKQPTGKNEPNKKQITEEVVFWTTKENYSFFFKTDSLKLLEPAEDSKQEGSSLYFHFFCNHGRSKQLH